jgi:hypothetical protein
MSYWQLNSSERKRVLKILNRIKAESEKMDKAAARLQRKLGGGA